MAKRYQLYVAERKKGKTYQEIADQFGVSRQCVQQACATRHGSRKVYKNLNCIYPTLRKWMFDHNYSAKRLHREACACGMVVCYTPFLNRLRGKTKITFLEADILSDITGMPAKELFAI